MIQKESFISNLLGPHTYEDFRKWAILIAMVGSSVLLILYLLSYFFHASIISYLLKLTNGTSLLFIAYILALIVSLDVRVDVKKQEKKLWEKEKKEPKPFKYKLTIVWGFVLFILGVLAIYYSNKYRNHYAFECETFLVDEKAGIYHLDWNDDCSATERAESLELMKGYQINESYRFCEECKEYLEDAEADADIVHARP